MALHGEIASNSERLVQWAAQRTITGEHGTHTYTCEVSWIDDGNREIMKRFEVSHRESDGPIALASKVLSRADSASRWRR